VTPACTGRVSCVLSSWINQVNRWFALFSQQPNGEAICLGQDR